MVLLYSILKPKKKSTQWLQEVDNQNVELTLSNQSIIEQCQSIGLTLQDLKVAKTIQILIKENASAISSVFFKGMSHIPGYTSIIQEFSNEERCNTAKSKFESSLKEAGATRYLAKSADSGSVLPFCNPRLCSQAIASVAFGGGSIWSTCITTLGAICSS